MFAVFGKSLKHEQVKKGLFCHRLNIVLQKKQEQENETV